MRIAFALIALAGATAGFAATPAALRAEGCAILLGSATPALESWHNAQRGKYTLLRLPERSFIFDVPPKFVYSMCGVPRG